MKISIIIPIYNESRWIDAVITKIKSARLPDNIVKEVIIINDGSTDNTSNKLKKYNGEPQIKIFHQMLNKGKGHAVRLGFEKLTGDIILIQDADLEYDPSDYHKLIEPIIKNKALIVYGSRFKGTIKRMPLINRIANILSNITLNVLFHTKLTDVHTCYKVFRKEVLKDIKITSERFTFDTEITAKILKKGHTIYEVPISYTARSRKEGKKITYREALRVYWGIIKFRFKN